MWVDLWVRKISWRRKWQPTAVFLPGKSHEQGSLVGYSPCGHKRAEHDLVRMHILSAQATEIGHPGKRQLCFLCLTPLSMIRYDCAYKGSGPSTRAGTQQCGRGWGEVSPLTAITPPGLPRPGSLAHPMAMRRGEVGSQTLPQSTHLPVFVSSCHEDFGSRTQPSQQGLPGPPAFPVPGGSKDRPTPPPAVDLRKPRGVGMGIG